MKTAIVFADGIKQIVMTPENDSERQALKLFTVNDDVQLALIEGSFYDKSSPKPFTATISKSLGGYLRCYNDSDSIMFVLSPKEKKENNDQL